MKTRRFERALEESVVKSGGEERNSFEWGEGEREHTHLLGDIEAKSVSAMPTKNGLKSGDKLMAGRLVVTRQEGRPPKKKKVCQGDCFQGR